MSPSDSLTPDVQRDRESRHAEIASSALLEAFMQDNTIGLAVFDRQHRYVRVNQRLAEINGVSIAEHIGRTMSEVIAPPRTAPDDAIEQVFTSGKSVDNLEIVEPLPNPSGHVRYWTTSFFPIPADGPPQWAGVLVTETTEHKHAQAALRSTEDRFRMTFENAAVGIAHISPEGHWLEVNQRLCEILGYTRETLLQKTTQEITYPEDIEGTVTGLLEMAAGNLPLYVREKRYMRGDGAFIWTSVTASPVLDRETGKPSYIIAFIQDISARKQMEDHLALLASAGTLLTAGLDVEQALQAVTNMLVPAFADWCAVELIGDNGEVENLTIAHTDPEKLEDAYTLRRYFRFDADSPTGVPGVIRSGESEVYPAISDEFLVASSKSEEHLRLLRTIGFHSTLIVPLTARQRSLGALVLVTSNSKYTYTEADVRFAEELGNYAAFAIDNARLYDAALRSEIELRQLNETLEQRVAKRTAELDRSNRDLQDFAYIASHDLQEPLRKIVAFGDRLREMLGAEMDPTIDDYLARMQNAAGRMQGLITALLTLSRISTRNLNAAEVDLAQVIRDEVLIDLESALEESGGTIEIGELPRLTADTLQMRQLLQNLLSNGLKFRRPGVAPRLRVYSKQIRNAQTDALFYRIFVEDNGIGFDQKYIDRIFQPFQRLHGQQQYAGTGMGLAICRKIAERHGGSITASSTPGSGSAFIVTLPAVPPNGSSHTAA